MTQWNPYRLPIQQLYLTCSLGRHSNFPPCTVPMDHLQVPDHPCPYPVPLQFDNHTLDDHMYDLLSGPRRAMCCSQGPLPQR